MTKLGRALLLAGLAGAAILGACGRSFADMGELAQAARKEGLVTWYVASIDTRNAEAAGRIFTAKYGPKVVVVRAPPQVAFQRLTHDLAENSNNADVFSSVGIGNFLTLKQNGALASYKPVNAAALLPAFRSVDKDNTFHTTVASLVVLGYNKARVRPRDVPNNWSDLTEPKWYDKIALANPAFSGFTGNWAAQMNKLYGKPFFVALHQQKPQIDRSVPDSVKQIASGDRLITASPIASIMESADSGEPLDIVYPADGSILVATLSAILKNAPHPNAAKLFMEFLLGPEFGHILVSAHYEAMRPDVQPLPGAKSVSEVKTILPSVQDSTAGVSEAAKLWQSVFGQ